MNRTQRARVLQAPLGRTRARALAGMSSCADLRTAGDQCYEAYNDATRVHVHVRRFTL